MQKMFSIDDCLDLQALQGQATFHQQQLQVTLDQVNQIISKYSSDPNMKLIHDTKGRCLGVEIPEFPEIKDNNPEQLPESSSAELTN